MMLRPLLQMLGEELSGQNCLDHVQTITRYHRIQASPGYRAAAGECLQVFTRSGLNARMTAYPATGRTRAWTRLIPQEWDCRDAELWLLGPDGQRLERLAWYQEMNLSIIQRSCATPPEGVTAELAVVENADQAASWEGRNLAGKIVLVGNGDIHRMLHHAREAGAVGLVTARMTYNPPVRPEGDLADALQYTSFWWTEDETPGWGFVLSTRQGERLKQLASRGSVRLWARVDASSYDGAMENVEAVIPGTSNQEVLVVAHLCHPKPSANDNASGPATVMEAARTLARLIRSGRLPQPRRTIRFLLVPEMTGTFAHLAALSEEERARIVAAINVDMVGQNQNLAGSTLLCEYPPLACPSFTGDLLSRILDEVAQEIVPLSGFGKRYAQFRYATVPYSGGSDHMILADPTVGVPCPMIIQWPDRFYHTSSDSMDKSDPQMMRRVSLMTAAYAAFLAGAGLPEATWLAAEMTALFPAQLHDALSQAGDPEAMAGFRLDRKLADLASLDRLVDAADQEPFQHHLDVFRQQLKLTAELELQRTLLTGSAPSVQPPSDPPAVQGWSGEADLRRICPTRVYPGPVSLREYLSTLPGDVAESWRQFTAGQEGHPAAVADQLCYWADGTRSLAEICRLTELETGQRCGSWALGFFQLLARLGLVTGV